MYENDSFNNDFIQIEQYLKPIFEKSTEKENDLNRIRIACERITNANYGKFDPAVTIGLNVNNEIVTLYNSKIRAQITLIGFQYILDSQRQEKLDQSILDTNVSVKKSNFWTPFIAALAALFALAGLVKDCKKSSLITPPLQQIIDKQALTLDSLQETLENIDSSLRHKNDDTLKVVQVEMNH